MATRAAFNIKQFMPMIVIAIFAFVAYFAYSKFNDTRAAGKKISTLIFSAVLLGAGFFALRIKSMKKFSGPLLATGSVLLGVDAYNRVKTAGTLSRPALAETVRNGQGRIPSFGTRRFDRPARGAINRPAQAGGRGGYAMSGGGYAAADGRGW